MTVLRGYIRVGEMFAGNASGQVGQPQSFDIDGFFATRPEEFLWLARQYAAEIAPGDQVFIWRAIGGEEREKAGSSPRLK